ncbi:MAG: DUF4157 domain-containing protein [Cytophagales bacterium]|nr:MAG: DUF4157 domain-containing protein [Cytophagales bacterium]TAF59647.1 MAG: DUF4157 domain-containing protein [Cytophagales bacterium]
MKKEHADHSKKSENSAHNHESKAAAHNESSSVSPINPQSIPVLSDVMQLKEAITNSEHVKQIQLKKSGGGAALPSPVRDKMEGAFGQDFSQVKVHTNSESAAQLKAHAFAEGNDIHFAQGKFNPESTSGQELIGHELTHVVQQRSGKVKANNSIGNVPINDSPSLENEADKMGSMAAQGKSIAQFSGLNTSNKQASSSVKQGLFGSSTKAISAKEGMARSQELLLMATNSAKNARITYLQPLVLAATNTLMGVGVGKRNRSDEAKALREELKGFATKTANDNIDAGSDQANIRSDAKSYTKAAIRTKAVKAAMNKAISTEAGKYAERACSVFDADIQAYIYDRLMKGVNYVDKDYANRKSRLEEFCKEAALKHKEAAISSAAFMFSSNVTNGAKKEEMNERIKGTLKTDIKDLGKSEVNDRLNYEALWAAPHATLMVNVEKEAIFDPIKATVAEKLTANGASWYQFRSKETHGFRNELKNEARSQMAKNIGNEISNSTNEKVQNAGDATKAYYQMLASESTRGVAKESVNEELMVKAIAFTTDVIPHEATNKAIKEAGQTTGYKYYRENKDNLKPQKELEAVKAGSLAKAKELMLQYQVKGIQKAHDFVKGADKDNNKTTIKQDIVKNVNDKEQRDQTARKAVQKAVDAPDLNTAMRIVAGMIDVMVPQPGSSLDLDLQLRVIEPNTNIYFITQFKGSVEKDVDYDSDTRKDVNSVSARTQLSLGAGWTASGLIDIDAQIGFFLEAQANTSQKLMQLISYGFYRSMQNDTKTGKAANFVWGKGGKTYNKLGQKNTAGDEAETWAAMIEEQVLKTSGQDKSNAGSYVEMGGLAKVKGKGNIGVGSMEGEIAYNRGKRVSAETVGSGLGKEKTQEQLKEANAGIAMNTINAEISTELFEGSGKFALEGALSWVSGKSGQPSMLHGFSVEGSGAAIATIGGDYSAFVRNVAIYAAPILSGIKTLALLLQNKAKTSEKAGAVADLGTNIAVPTTVSTVDGGSMKSFFEGIGSTKDKVTGGDVGLLELKSAMQVGAGFEFERDLGEIIKYQKGLSQAKPTFEKALTVSLNSTSIYAGNTPMAAVSFGGEIEKKNRLVMLKWGSSGLTLEVVGFRKTFAS